MSKKFEVFVDFPSHVCVHVEAESANEAEEIVENMSDYQIWTQEEILQNMQRGTALAREVVENNEQG